jgi:hypothetical protein
VPAPSTNSPGFESGVTPATRRALLDLQRQIVALEARATAAESAIDILEAAVRSARFSLSANIAVAHNTNTAIPWNVRTGDDGLWDTANPTRLVAPSAGTYLVTSTVRTDSNPTSSGAVASWVSKNGTTGRLASTEFSQIGGIGESLAISTVVPMLAGDYLQVFFYQNSGISMAVWGDAQGIPNVTSASFTRIGP